LNPVRPATAARAAAIAAAVMVICAPVMTRPARAGSSAQAVGGAVTVTSDEMVADADENLIVFKGDVVAKEDFTICSDELRIRYGPAREISEIVANGRVTIHHEDKTATSGTAVYDRKARLVVLTGSPEILQCADTVKGDKITVYLDSDNALVEGGGDGRVRALIMPERDCLGAAGDGGRAGEDARCRRPR
jgi:lipopolysaccharide transport protein LptA